MLEEILKSINSNLERIFNAEEKRNELLANQIKPLEIGVDLGTGVNQTVPKAAPQASAVIPQPIVEQTPVQLVQQPVVPQAIPTTQIQESFTQEQLAVAMSNAVSAGKMDVIQNILQQFGVQALTQINQADYNKVATMLKEAGVEV